MIFPSGGGGGYRGQGIPFVEMLKVWRVLLKQQAPFDLLYGGYFDGDERRVLVFLEKQRRQRRNEADFVTVGQLHALVVTCDFMLLNVTFDLFPVVFRYLRMCRLRT